MRGSGRATVALALLGLVGVGALAERAWIARPVPQVAVRRAEPGAVPPLLLAVVDGLRAERALPGPESAMPFLAGLAREGVSGIADAGDLTMTLGCVRAILTGREPDLSAALRNFRGEPVEGDVVSALLERGAVAAHAGDAAIAQLLAGRLPPERVLAFPDRGPRDQGETDDRSVVFARRQIEEGVDVLTVHLVRPDHAGHRHGAAGPEYREACRRSDEQLRSLVEPFRLRHPRATVLVAADHGVTRQGNHGGGEAEAANAPFVLVGLDVASRADVRVPQTALAPTLAALLRLPQPAHAHAPPATSLTTLPLEERLAALDEHLRLRIEAARALDRLPEAAAAEAARRAALAEPPSEEVVARLEEEARRISAGLHARVAALVAVAILGLATAWAAALGWLASGGGRGAAAPVAARVAAGAFAFLVVAAAGRAVQDAFDAGHVSLGAASALAGLAVLGTAVAAWRGRGRLSKAFVPWPGLLLLGGGVAIGFPLTLRPFLDPVLGGPHLTRDLVALGGLTAVAAIAWRGRGSPRAVRIALVAVAVVLFVGVRVAERIGGEGWALSPSGASALAPSALALAVGLALALEALRRRRTDGLSAALATLALAAAWGYAATPETRPGAALWVAALLAAFLALLVASRRGTPDGRVAARCLAAAALARVLEPTGAAALVTTLACAGARLAGTLWAPASRAGMASLALGLVAIVGALFHASGNAETLSTVRTGTGFLPAAFGLDPTPGAGASADVVLAVVLVSLRFALPWIAAFAACARGFERAGRPGTLALLGDVAVVYAARGAAVVLALALWWRNVWWLDGARAVYVFAFAEIVLAALACSLAPSVLRRAAATVPPRSGGGPAHVTDGASSRAVADRALPPRS